MNTNLSSTDGTVKETNSGYSFVEVLVAFALVMGVVVGTMYVSQLSRNQSTRFKNTNDCSSFANNFTNNLKTANGPIRIRNWLPTYPGEIRAPGDTVDQFTRSIDGSVALEEFYNSQNIINTTNWALALYNNHNPKICNSKSGLTFSGAHLNKLLSSLPIPIQKPTDLESIQLVVTKRDLGNSSIEGFCSSEDVKAHPKLTTAFDVKMNFKFSGDECSSEFRPQFHHDESKSKIAAAFRNGENKFFESDAGSSCRRECAKSEEFNKEKLPFNACEERHAVSMDVMVDEPGTLIFCKRKGPAWLEREDSKFKPCHEIASSFKLVSDSENMKTHAKFTFANVADYDIPYVVQILAVDTGGNKTEAEFNFRVNIPKCQGADIVTTDCEPGQDLWEVDDYFICTEFGNEPDSCNPTRCKQIKCTTKVCPITN